MDTSRIEINITDNSTSLIENPTAITGFTVVKAPKGPATPIRVRSGAAAAIKDIFGVSSKDYPELFEAEVFNSEYDLWISAPYTSAKVPVAYVTKDGVMEGASLLTYDATIEKIINGEYDLDIDGISRDGFNSIGNAGVKCLSDIRYNLSQNILDTYQDIVTTQTVTSGDSESSDSSSDTTTDGDSEGSDSSSTTTETVQSYLAHDLGSSYILGYEEKYDFDANTKVPAVVIDLGIPASILLAKSASVGYTGNTVDNVSTIKIKGLPSGMADTFTIGGWEDAPTQTGNVQDPLSESVRIKVSDPKSSKVVGYLGFPEQTKNDVNYDYVDMSIYLFGNAESTLTTSFVKNNLDQIEERRNLSVFFVKTFTGNDVYGTIIPKYPSSRPLTISFNAFNDANGYGSKSYSSRNILKMDISEEGAFRDHSHPVHVEGSLDNDARNANGAKIGFINENSDYRNQNLIYVQPIKTFTPSDTFNKKVQKYPTITLTGGFKDFNIYKEATLKVEGNTKKFESGVTYYTYDKANNKYVEVTASNPTDSTTYYTYEYDSTYLHNLGWEIAKDGDYSDVDIFFDSELHDVDSTPGTLKGSTFFSLATVDKNNHELAGYYFNATLSPGVVDMANAEYQLTFGRNYWNVDNQAIINLSDGGAKILSPLTGAMALMECRILENRYGGVAPMWENSGSPSMGGQLRSIVGIYKLRYRYTKTQLDTLDDFNYNPVINDRQYGFMVVGQKTCQAGESTDWSYIGHAASFLNFIKEIRANIMIPQIGKPNNPYYRTLRKEQVERYLARRLEGNNRIWAWADVDTSTRDGVNDVFARKARKFVINVRVMVDTYSEKVVLNFTNEDQSTTVSIA